MQKLLPARMHSTGFTPQCGFAEVAHWALLAGIQVWLPEALQMLLSMMWPQLQCLQHGSLADG